MSAETLHRPAGPASALRRPCSRAAHASPRHCALNTFRMSLSESVAWTTPPCVAARHPAFLAATPRRRDRDRVSGRRLHPAQVRTNDMLVRLNAPPAGPPPTPPARGASEGVRASRATANTGSEGRGDTNRGRGQAEAGPHPRSHLHTGGVSVPDGPGPGAGRDASRGWSAGLLLLLSVPATKGRF